MSDFEPGKSLGQMSAESIKLSADLDAARTMSQGENNGTALAPGLKRTNSGGIMRNMTRNKPLAPGLRRTNSGGIMRGPNVEPPLAPGLRRTNSGGLMLDTRK